MNAVVHAVRLGAKRGWIEFKYSLANSGDLSYLIIMNLIFAAVLFFQKDTEVDGLMLALITLPSLLGMSIVYNGVINVASNLSYEREDGTLLRAKSTPHGIVGYVISRVILAFGNTLFSLLIILAAGSLIIGGMGQGGLYDWLWFAVLIILGLTATIPWGAIIGSLVKSASSGFGYPFLLISGIVAISGIFYPFAALASWLQVVAQVFPVYWLGLGMRSVFLPDSAALLEVGGSWRPFETVVVLLAWAAVGLALAPRILRHMARHESGSAMETRKQRAMQRGAY